MNDVVKKIDLIIHILINPKISTPYVRWIIIGCLLIYRSIRESGDDQIDIHIYNTNLKQLY